MDTKKLRQKILDLAIRGKLVPQDPNDEPASVLLERIRAEKEQLIKEGKIKRSKKSVASDTSHYENVPFEVPESWEWVTVGDIFTHNTGKALNSSNSQGEIMSYITTSNLYWNRFDLTVIKEMPFTESEVAKCTVTRGDLLVCEGGDIGRAAIWNYDFDIRIQNHIHRLRSIIQLNHLFYYHVFYLFKSLNLIGGKGVAIQGLSSSDLAKLLVPLPPISEQNRIISELNRWLSVVDQIELDQYSLKNTIADIKNRILCLAISGKLVGQDISDEPAIELLKKINPSYISCDNRHYANVPYKVPQKWQWVTLSDISNYGECINVPVSNIPENSWILELEDIEKDSGRLIQRMNKSKRNINGVRHSFKKGDVLYSKLRTYLNKVLVADQDGYCTTEIIPITCVQGIVPEYLCHVLRSKYYVDYTISLGYGVKMPRLGTGDALKSMIPVPPYEEQRRIVKSVNEIYHKLEQISSEL